MDPSNDLQPPSTVEDVKQDLIVNQPSAKQVSKVKQPSKDDKLESLKAVATKYEIVSGSIIKLRKLESYDIVVIADDSSSMNTAAKHSSMTTRWTELRDRISEIVEVMVCLDPDGIDIYFINGKTHERIADSNAVERLFDKRPDGFTPLTECYSRVLRDRASQTSNRPVLIIVATDGEPNREVSSGGMISDVEGFRNAISQRKNPQQSPTVIMACTDSPFEIGWLNGLDRDAPNVDVVSEYRKELGEIRSIQGKTFPFSKGDYIVKTLIGPMDPLYDTLDQKKMNAEQFEEYVGRPMTITEKNIYKQADETDWKQILTTCCCR